MRFVQSVAKIKIIPIELPFLPTLASYVWDKFSGCSPDLSEVLLVFPSQRNKFYFRRYLLKSSGRRGIIPPTMLTIQEFTSLIFERLGGKKGKSLIKLERNLILKYVVDTLKIRFWKDLDFLKFISIGDRLLSFFDELQREDVTLDKLEELKERLHFPERYVENEIVIIRKIFDEYRGVLRSSGYTDTEHEYELIKREFEPEVLRDFKYILISGVLAPTKVEGNIIRKILYGLPSELVLHSKREEIKEDLTSPFYNHDRLIHSLGKSVEEIIVIGDKSYQKSNLPAGRQVSKIKNQRSAENNSYYQSTIYNLKSAVHITRLKSQMQEILYIKDILMKLVGRYEPHRIGVILTDNSLVSPIKTAIESAGYNFNLSMGMPFSRSLLYSFLSLLGEAVKKNFHHKEFLALIRHPLLKNAKLDGCEARSIIYALERGMIKENKIFFRFDDFEDNEYKPFFGMIKGFADKISESSNFSTYVEGIEEMLSLLLSRNPEFMASGMLGIEDFLKHIRETSKLIMTEDVFPTGIEKLDFILRVLEDATYSIEGNPFKGIQLIGVLEARNLDFDCVILPSMNEGVFPQKSEKDLFVPAQLRKEVGLPYDKERENLFYYYFTQLSVGKKEVYISYVEREDRDVCSRFVSFLRDEGMRVYESPVVFEKEKGRKSEPMPKDDALIKRLEEMLYTPSSLRDYRVCPYRFYLKYVLGIKEPKKIVEEAGAVEWGNIIHGALRRFYSEDFPSHFTGENLRDAERTLYSRVGEKLRKMIGWQKASSLFDLEVYKRRMKRFLNKDLKRFEKGYRIHCVEKRLDFEIHLDGRRLKIMGNTDRIDTLDGRYYIIDYKTGREIDKKCVRIGDDFTEFQLPLYALMFSAQSSQAIGGLLYYYISRNKVGTEDIMGEGYIQKFRNEILIPTLREIIDPKTTFSRTDDERGCRICVYREFCGK